MKKVAILGAGPGGLGAAYALATLSSEYNITVYDKGKNLPERKRCEKLNGCHCQTCDNLSGLGGAGGFSDGKLNIHSGIGDNIQQFNLTDDEAKALVENIYHSMYKPFSPYLLSDPNYDEAKVKLLQDKAQKQGVTFIPIKQQHIGSDKLPLLFQNLRAFLEKQGVTFKFEQAIQDIQRYNRTCIGLKTSQEHFDADYTILAPGRLGQDWLLEVCIKNNIQHSYKSPSFGVRVEVPHEAFEEILNTFYDPKFIVNYADGATVRTFCTNPMGFVVKEKYVDGVGVNGHAFKEIHSPNSNFALLYKENGADGLRHFEAARKTVQKITEENHRKPILQSLEDVIKKQPSDPKSLGLQPTLREVSYNNLSKYYDEVMLNRLVNTMLRLGQFIPGLADPRKTLFYGPELKYTAVKIDLDSNLQTSIKNLYCVGDGSGYVGDIMRSSAMGYLAAVKLIENNHS